MSNRATPAVHRSGAAFHATRQAAGVPSGAVAAPSRHLRATAPMGRRWDASEPEADQKAGAPGRHRSCRNQVQRSGSAISGSGSDQYPASEHAGIWHSPGRAGHGIVPTMPFRLPSTLRTMPMPGNPRSTPPRCGCSSRDAGRRRTIGAVATLQSSSARLRRWCDAGPPAAIAAADQKADDPVRLVNDLTSPASGAVNPGGPPHVR